jgi:hypothetical protein
MHEFVALGDAATARDDEGHSGIFLIQLFMQITKIYSIFLLNLKNNLLSFSGWMTLENDFGHFFQFHLTIKRFQSKSFVRRTITQKSFNRRTTSISFNEFFMPFSISEFFV